MLHLDKVVYATIYYDIKLHTCVDCLFDYRNQAYFDEDIKIQYTTIPLRKYNCYKSAVNNIQITQTCGNKNTIVPKNSMLVHGDINVTRIYSYRASKRIDFLKISEDMVVYTILMPYNVFKTYMWDCLNPDEQERVAFIKKIINHNNVNGYIELGILQASS
ncbi:hypothetical protein CcNV_034 [Crangon crangon nudivirus]|uniref:Uncharacterized protein n=1 Tax=Crangon crangon nudivirus TaxID=2880838 RepID=A0AAE8Y0X2_9VIRU|nr:hypothetical protein QKT25_gp034 [Crangon crangon nudivirus]UBZ25518.1 hypothetical protein CcNV_034 [Crangon crangon nudivirus]